MNYEQPRAQGPTALVPLVLVLVHAPVAVAVHSAGGMYKECMCTLKGI